MKDIILDEETVQTLLHILDARGMVRAKEIVEVALFDGLEYLRQFDYLETEAEENGAEPIDYAGRYLEKTRG